MTQSEFNSFLHHVVPFLLPEQMKQLRVALDNAPAGGHAETGEEEDQRAQRALHARGLLNEIKPSQIDPTPYLNRQPITILHGKPVSETLIEDRG